LSFFAQNFSQSFSQAPSDYTHKLTPQTFSACGNYIIDKHKELGINGSWTQEFEEAFTQAHNSPDFISADALKQKGLAQKYLDAMAIEYAKLKKNSYIVVFFPITFYKTHWADKRALQQLAQNGKIVYSKDVTLKAKGPLNALTQLYVFENWLDLPKHIWERTRKRFGTIGPDKKIHVLLWECASHRKMRDCKLRIRWSCWNKHESIHINDEHEETVLIANMLFHQKSIDAMNTLSYDEFAKLRHFTLVYNSWLKRNKYDPELFALDSFIEDQSVRRFLHYGHKDLEQQEFSQNDRQKNVIKLKSINNRKQTLPTTIDNIIFNPENYFYCRGVKIIGLPLAENPKTTE